jgi:hypothetical protein
MVSLKDRLEPAALEAIREVRVLDSHAAAVSLSQEINYLLHCPPLLLLNEELGAEVEGAVSVHFLQAKHRQVHRVRVVLEQLAHVNGIRVHPVDWLVRVELLVRAPSQRIQVRREVTAVPGAQR